MKNDKELFFIWFVEGKIIPLVFLNKLFGPNSTTMRFKWCTEICLGHKYPLLRGLNEQYYAKLKLMLKNSLALNIK